MVRITKELLQKRAEHNEGILSTLEEITLHQYNIEKIELIQSHCKHLKILYLQNNLIDKIENLYKLKELQYLNLALNNITKIEGLETCESLNKLDLTLNFIDIDNFEESVNNLKQNIFLSELHLTGNPCTDFKDYRLFIIHLLPQLKKLDSIEIKKSETIKAKQLYHSILKQIRKKSKEIKNRNNDKAKLKDKDVYKKSELYNHSVEGRKEAYYEEKEREEKQKKEDEKLKEKNPYKMPPDIIKQTRKKMCVIEQEGKNGELPKQRNIGRYEFKMEGINDLYDENIRVIIEAPKYLDTSEIFVDIHPLWFQVIIKQKSLLLHLSTEVKVNECRVRRVMCNGWLELIMPKLNYKKRPKSNNTKNVNKQKEKISTNIKEQIDSKNDHDSEIDFDEDEVPPLE
eukprot:299990_1